MKKLFMKEKQSTEENNKPTILYISHENKKDLGGASYSLLQHIKSVKHDFNAVVLCNKGIAADLFMKNGIECMICPFTIRLQVWYENRSRCKLIEKIVRIMYNYTMNILVILFVCFKHYFSKQKIDIVHSNTAVLDIGIYISKLIRKPHVWHLREFMNLDHDMEPLLGWNRMYKLCKKTNVICISNSIAEHYKVNKTNVIYDAVYDVEKQKEYGIKQKYFLYSSGKKIKKGILDAITAFKALNKRYNDYYLYLTGDYNNIRGYNIDDYIGNNDRIRILGYRNDILDLMHNASAYLMCSHCEGLGRVTIESSMSGTPVIGYNRGATSEIITDNKTGMLYEDVQQLTDKMEFCIENPDLMKTFVSNSQDEFNKRFSLKTYRVRILEKYNNILKL